MDLEISFTKGVYAQLTAGYTNTAILIYHTGDGGAGPCIDGQYIKVHYELDLDDPFGQTYGYNIFVIFGKGYFSYNHNGFDNWAFGPSSLMVRTENFININGGQNDVACKSA
jgi:hypothetical protein